MKFQVPEFKGIMKKMDYQIVQPMVKAMENFNHPDLLGDMAEKMGEQAAEHMEGILFRAIKNGPNVHFFRPKWEDVLGSYFNPFPTSDPDPDPLSQQTEVGWKACLHTGMLPS
jgi:hypothetical protein